MTRRAWLVLVLVVGLAWLGWTYRLQIIAWAKGQGKGVNR